MPNQAASFPCQEVLIMTVQPRKKLFDAGRVMLKRGFRQSEVDAIDTAIDGLVPART